MLKMTFPDRLLEKVSVFRTAVDFGGIFFGAENENLFSLHPTRNARVKVNLTTDVVGVGGLLLSNKP